MGRSFIAVRAALCVVVASTLVPSTRANPSGAQVAAGSAAFSTSGNALTVVTQTQQTAINWQSFSIASGQATRFVQPAATSTVLNRVVGPDPSLIFGTLSSNGRLVLVNPAGITVGAGAVVDTAAFTAATLRMTDADFLAGRLRFTAGADSGAIRVDGAIASRNGDIVLLAPKIDVGTDALVQARDGSVLLAAGRSAEIVARGLEGIRLEVRNTGDDVTNLGQLQGDAVGIFAASLRHSGLIRAQRATFEGGRVLLRADTDVGINAAQVYAGGSIGGRIDMQGSRIDISGTSHVDATGTMHGGAIAIGMADSSGAQAATHVTVGAGSHVRADATSMGSGGSIKVRASTAMQLAGLLSARAAASGGNGGSIDLETGNGLDLPAIPDTSAARGTWGVVRIGDAIRIDNSSPASQPISTGAAGGLAGNGTASVVLMPSGTLTLSASHAVTLQPGSLAAGSLTSIQQAVIAMDQGMRALLSQGGTVTLMSGGTLAATAGAWPGTFVPVLLTAQ